MENAGRINLSTSISFTEGNSKNVGSNNQYATIAYMLREFKPHLPHRIKTVVRFHIVKIDDLTRFGVPQTKTNSYLFGLLNLLLDNMKSKNLITIGLLILLLVVIINESRFIFWGAFGIPERSNSMNCGEERYNFNVKINSKSEFLNFIGSLKNLKDGDGGFRISQWARERNYTPNDIEVRNSMSLFFSQKLYSVPSCGGSMTFEISETGYASARGCCGI